MATFDIKVRNLESDETLIATLDSYDTAVAWLKDRPEMMEVLGVISDVSPVQMKSLKECMRPYDAKEMEKKQERSKITQKLMAEQMAKEQRMGELEGEKTKREKAAMDPNRPLPVHWTLDEGFSVSDTYDEREISEAAKKGIEVWIAERNSWVESRDQVVGECDVEVYPGPIPSGDEDKRVLAGGSFVPRLVEKKKDLSN